MNIVHVLLPFGLGLVVGLVIVWLTEFGSGLSFRPRLGGSSSVLGEEDVASRPRAESSPLPHGPCRPLEGSRPVSRRAGEKSAQSFSKPAIKGFDAQRPYRKGA